MQKYTVKTIESNTISIISVREEIGCTIFQRFKGIASQDRGFFDKMLHEYVLEVIRWWSYYRFNIYRFKEEV
ncbi:MAG: hypothetical protein GXZ06_05090 [Tissierellia bacterium]|nr:hypothetical protein [Tissierellia bacterium]